MHSDIHRRLRGSLNLRTILLAIVVSGCIVPASDDELTSSTEQESQGWRNDQNGILRPGDGYWGGWHQDIYCTDGLWAVGYQMRVEASQGGGTSSGNDDTSLNSVRLLCRNPTTGFTEWISSFDGIWGNWTSSATCSGGSNYLKGASMRIESPQGGGDDTAANDVKFTCTQGGTIQAPGAHTWGSWGDWAYCPNNTAVCGLSIRFEGALGGGDDTAMNGLELHCCDLPSGGGGGAYCSDGICQSGETASSCLADCGYCGDGICYGESSSSCPGDCGGGGGGGGGGCPILEGAGDASELQLPCPLIE